MSIAHILLSGHGRVEVPATIIGDLAVHKWTHDGVSFRADYRISHVPSGCCIDNIVPGSARRTKRACVAWARSLVEGCGEHWAIIKAACDAGIDPMTQRTPEIHQALKAIHAWAFENRKAAT